MNYYKNIECNNCQKIIESDYKFCPLCGYDLLLADTNNKESLDQSDILEKTAVRKLNVSQVIFKTLGIILLALDAFVLIWFCWSGYVGHFVKFNKPVPKEVFNIDGQFFNLAGTDQIYKTLLIILILFGFIKVGFWLIKTKNIGVR